MFKSIYSDYLKPYTFTSAKEQDLVDMGSIDEIGHADEWRRTKGKNSGELNIDLPRINNFNLEIRIGKSFLLSEILSNRFYAN